MHLVLAHGASGSAASMRPHVAGLAQRGVAASAIDLPIRRAEDAVTAYRTAMLAARGAGTARPAIGGHSYGGRVASLLAAQDADVASALVLLSYPLHRPGHPDWEARSAHWPAIGVPVLLISGESDPFARLDLLRRAVSERLPRAELVTFPRVGHGLGQVLWEALDAIAAFLRPIGASSPG